MIITKANKRPTVIDLFAGAGIFSSAFSKEGFKLNHAVEIDPIASQTYRLNLGNHIEVNDISKATPSNKCDVIIAGPPCQGFSTLGKRNPNDSRNLLSLHILTWAKHCKPDVVIVENVVAFLKTKIALRLKQKLSSLGYQIETHVHNAFDFGVPQIRKRSFIIASKIGLPLVKSIKVKPVRTVREAWRGLSSEPNGINNHYAPNPSEIAFKRMSAIPEGGSKLDVIKNAPELVAPSWVALGNQATDVWGRLEWDKPSNTLRTCLQNASKGRYIHPEQNRVISLREASRLHTISDKWEFYGSPTQIARQIGNSVPWMLGRAVAKATMKQLRN